MNVEIEYIYDEETTKIISRLKKAEEHYIKKCHECFPEMKLPLKFYSDDEHMMALTTIKQSVLAKAIPIELNVVVKDRAGKIIESKQFPING